MNTYETQELFGEIKDSYEIQVLCENLGSMASIEYPKLLKNASIKLEQLQRKAFLTRGLKVFKNILFFQDIDLNKSIREEAMDEFKTYLRKEVEDTLNKYNKDTSNLHWNRLK